MTSTGAVPDLGHGPDPARDRAGSEEPRCSPGNAEHGIRNSGDGPLRFVYAFATDSIDDVVYRFSDDE